MRKPRAQQVITKRHYRSATAQSHPGPAKVALSRFPLAARRVLLLGCFTALSFFVALAGAARGGQPATGSGADSSLAETGLSKWIAEVYYADLWWYGVLVVVVMAVMGVILGYGTDRLLTLLRIDLGRLPRHE